MQTVFTSLINKSTPLAVTLYPVTQAIYSLFSHIIISRQLLKFLQRKAQNKCHDDTMHYIRVWFAGGFPGTSRYHA